ncbi:MAG: DMT family transporter [Acetobacteraceae bacterium]|nr:DMT family transporter [Acetobacteraceae bacterium]MDW8399924.1 DMT family transporter [Acetobacteraceae bacterium]
MLAGAAFLALSMALVGANVPVAKLLAEDLPLPLIAGLRCLLACLVLLPVLRAAGLPPRLPERRDASNLALQAAFGTVLYNLALLAGLRLTSALEGGLMLATLPAMVAVGGALWLREALAPRVWAAVALAVGGMAALASAAAGGAGSLAGNALVLAAVAGEAAYVLLAKRAAGRLPVLLATFWMQAFSALMLLPLWLPVAAGAAALASPGVAALLVFHALTSSVLCLLLWYAGLRRVPAGIAGVFTLFLPATASAVAVGVLGEAFTPAHAAGFALMLASVLLATWPGGRR